MQLAFYRGRGRFVDWLIKYWTQGRFSHVEVVFSDGMCYSSSPRDGGVRFKKIDLKDEKWDVLEVDVGDETVVREWCKTQVGKGYDFLGIFGFAILPHRNDVQSNRRWYCSEISAEVLRRVAPKTYHSIPKRISPAMLHAWLGGEESWSR